MTNRNLGRFKISCDLIDEFPDTVAEVFKMMECIPVRAEMLYTQGVVEYVAISKLFPIVEYNQVVPEYYIKIEKAEAGNVELVEAVLI